MLILDFIKKFPDEQSCRLYFKEKREKRGITCKCCKNTKHYWFEKQGLWKCAKCGSRTNLRAGTIMEQSNLPFNYWFVAIHLMTATKKSFSALELQRQLGHNRYEPIWLMMNKIRIMMGKRDSQYKLHGDVEIDEGFFEVVNFEFKKTGKKLKKGRGSERQLPVLVMAEATPLTELEISNKTKKHTPNKKAGHVKMIVMTNLKEEGVLYEIKKAIDNNATAHTDAYESYSNLFTLVDTHNRMVVPKKEVPVKLPWVHTFISNAKRLLLGVHHSIGKNYLQNYLNEYVYKLNRRYLEEDIFDKMLNAGFNGSWNR